MVFTSWLCVHEMTVHSSKARGEVFITSNPPPPPPPLCLSDDPCDAYEIGFTVFMALGIKRKDECFLDGCDGRAGWKLVGMPDKRIYIISAK